MWSVFVILSNPTVGDFSDFTQITEQIQVQHLCSIGSVEAFNVCILIRLSWLDIIDHHAQSSADANAKAVYKAIKAIRTMKTQQQHGEYAKKGIATKTLLARNRYTRGLSAKEREEAIEELITRGDIEAMSFKDSKVHGWKLV